MLRENGAEVFYGENLTMKEFRTLEKMYLDALRKGDIGVVYLSGHAYMHNSATQLMTVTDVKPNMKEHAVNVRKLNVRSIHWTHAFCACANTSNVPSHDDTTITITQDEKTRNQSQRVHP